MKQIMTTYAWKEDTSDPDYEYRIRRGLYERLMRTFKKSLREKYGSENVKSLEDYSRMPVRASQVSYSDEIINLHVFAEGGSYPISNTKHNVGTSDTLFHWILHLCRKPWITGQILFDFIELVSKLYGIDVPWDFDLEHQSFPEDCDGKGGAK